MGVTKRSTLNEPTKIDGSSVLLPAWFSMLMYTFSATLGSTLRQTVLLSAGAKKKDR